MKYLHATAAILCLSTGLILLVEFSFYKETEIFLLSVVNIFLAVINAEIYFNY